VVFLHPFALGYVNADSNDPVGFSLGVIGVEVRTCSDGLR